MNMGQNVTNLSANVLIIEDNDSAAHLTMRMLDKVGTIQLNTTVCGTLAEGLLKIDEHIDLILLDINLPNGSGVEVLRRVHRKASLYNLPIIVLTAEERYGTAFVCGKMPLVTDYVVKRDVTADGLASSVRFALQQNRVELRMRAGEATLIAAEASLSVEQMAHKIEESRIIK